jgi:hypothetical protein
MEIDALNMSLEESWNRGNAVCLSILRIPKRVNVSGECLPPRHATERVENRSIMDLQQSEVGRGVAMNLSYLYASSH